MQDMNEHGRFHEYDKQAEYLDTTVLFDRTAREYHLGYDTVDHGVYHAVTGESVSKQWGTGDGRDAASAAWVLQWDRERKGWKQDRTITEWYALKGRGQDLNMADPN